MDVDRSRSRERADGPVLVLGAAGQLGEVIVELFGRAWTTVSWTHTTLDLTESARVMAAIADLRPWAIVNCAAYNRVDDAEDQPIAALETNAFVVRTIARAASKLGAALVHYSTDFVFDGESDTPYREDDLPNPRSVYAASKLLGEWFAGEIAAYYVLRVESLFGGLSRRKGSLDGIIRAIAAGQPVRAFTDRVVSPSYVWDVARATVALLQKRPASGVYHCVNSGTATWYEVADEVRVRLGVHTPIERITLRDAGLRAERPRYSALANDKLRRAGIVMPPWQDALARELAHESGR